MSCSGKPARNTMPPPSPVQVWADVHENHARPYPPVASITLLRAEPVQAAVGHVERDHAAALAVLHDQIQREILDEERRGVLEGLLIQGMQHRVSGAVGRGARALRGSLAVMGRHTAERALIDPAILGARERHAVVLQFDDRGGRLLAHEFDRVLIAEPVGTFDRVIHVPAPIVGAHVAERRRYSALRRHRMAACRKHLGETGCAEAGLGHAERRPQSGAARADDDDVVGVIREFVVRHDPIVPSVRCKIANTPAPPANTCRNRRASSDASFAAGECT